MFDTASPHHSSAAWTDTTEAMPHAQWIESALQQLRAQWPDADSRRLRAIADELFADPHSGLLDPQQAVHNWLRLLGAEPPLHEALRRVDVGR